MKSNGKDVDFAHRVDQPTSWGLDSRALVVRGWCFAGNGSTVKAVRLRIPGGVLSGVVGLPRPDVKVALREAPDNNTGFEIRGMLPQGRFKITLEAGLIDGSWHELANHIVTVRHQLLPNWLGRHTVSELITLQMPTQMAHVPRPLRKKTPPAISSNYSGPKFSVVTPSYNQARFLAETIESVLQQKIPVDYVVQDGGSTDASGSITGQYASRLHSVESKPDAGQADAIAKGFARTSGGPEDVMAWINSDDFYLPGAFSCVASYFNRNPAVDVLYGHRVVVNEDSQEIARWFLPKHDPQVLLLNDFVPQETLFWRRRIWDKVGGLDTSFKFAMDWDLLLRFQSAGAKIARVPCFLACFRVHPAQKTAAAMHDVGQHEIDLLRTRANGRYVPSTELENNPHLLRYLRRSAFIEFLWKLGIRVP